jgi:hypothetical protein
MKTQETRSRDSHQRTARTGLVIVELRHWKEMRLKKEGYPQRVTGKHTIH